MSIFYDVVTAIAVMHSQYPAISHRDLKVENILIGSDGSYKLCDFGSATQRAYQCASQREVARATEDIERHTTLAYRAPEAVDPWQRMRIDEKQDVWALGVLLYYLCFFKLPFEESNLAILGGRYTVPQTAISDSQPELMALLKAMLTQDPKKRPDVFTVLEGLSKIQGGVGPSVSRPTLTVAQPVGDQPIPEAPLENPKKETREEPVPAPPSPLPADAATALPSSPLAFDNLFFDSVVATPATPPTAKSESIPISEVFFSAPHASATPPPKPLLDNLFSSDSAPFDPFGLATFATQPISSPPASVSPLPQSRTSVLPATTKAPPSGDPKKDPFATFGFGSGGPPKASPQAIGSAKQQPPQSPFGFASSPPSVGGMSSQTMNTNNNNNMNNIMAAFNSGGPGLGGQNTGVRPR